MHTHTYTHILPYCPFCIVLIISYIFVRFLIAQMLLLELSSFNNVIVHVIYRICGNLCMIFYHIFTFFFNSRYEFYLSFYHYYFPQFMYEELYSVFIIVKQFIFISLNIINRFNLRRFTIQLQYVGSFNSKPFIQKSSSAGRTEVIINQKQTLSITKFYI